MNERESINRLAVALDAWITHDVRCDGRSLDEPAEPEDRPHDWPERPASGWYRFSDGRRRQIFPDGKVGFTTLPDAAWYWDEKSPSGKYIYDWTDAVPFDPREEYVRRCMNEGPRMITEEFEALIRRRGWEYMTAAASSVCWLDITTDPANDPDADPK
jgi:hypothetical protein